MAPRRTCMQVRRFGGLGELSGSAWLTHLALFRIPWGSLGGPLGCLGLPTASKPYKTNASGAQNHPNLRKPMLWELQASHARAVESLSDHLHRHVLNHSYSIIMIVYSFEHVRVEVGT